MTTYYNPFSLQGKIILVTGASSGIGKATAIECSKMGAKVIISARNESRLNATFVQLEGEGHKSIICDILNEDDLKFLVNNVGEIDGAVLCSGVVETIPALFSTRKKLDKMFNTNFFSTVELSRLLLKNKRIKKDGSLVVLSSAGGTFSVDPGNGIYGASKIALATWLKFLALEIAHRGIRVNSICPGMVKTPMTQPDIISEEQLKKDEEKYPLKRYGEPQEIAYACVYFLSDASKWVTGTNFLIDGGSILK